MPAEVLSVGRARGKVGANFARQGIPVGETVEYAKGMINRPTDTSELTWTDIDSFATIKLAR